MLSTKPEDKYPDRYFAPEGGSSTWRRVCLDQDVPFFVLRVQILEGVTWTAHTYILSSTIDLLDLCRASGDCEDVRVQQVAILCPPATEVDIGWRLRDLDEIKASPNVNQGRQVSLFKTKDGYQFLDPASAAPDMLDELPVVFRAGWYQSVD